MKKQLGEKADSYYKGVQPEYTTMSNGIGQMWIEKYWKDAYPVDEIVIRGTKRCKPPKFYDDVYDYKTPDGVLPVKEKRVEAAKERKIDLRAAEKIKLKQVERLRKVIG